MRGAEVLLILATAVVVAALLGVFAGPFIT